MIKERCKICRRLGVKLFLKGERCFGQKCEIVKRNYPPGIRSKKRNRKISGYGRELAEKQKLRRWYNLGEKQFKKYVKETLEKGSQSGNAGDLLIKRLESRLDNMVFRLGLAKSRIEARQSVNHGHFLVNGKKVNIPSYELKKNDEVEVKEGSKKKKKFQDMKVLLKGYQVPAWLSLNIEEMKGKVLELPTEEEANVPVETLVVFEFYSK
jgi:small subunit ribosomal protein S4